MRVAVTVLPTLYCLQSLAKFAIHFLVPYDKRIGMSVIQVYFHRFIHPPPPDKMPESPVPPVKLVWYAIQAPPGMAWREYLLMSIAAIWGLYVVIADGWLARWPDRHHLWVASSHGLPLWAP